MNTEKAIKVLSKYHDSALLKTHMDFLCNPQNYQTDGVPNQFICDTESVRLALDLAIEALKRQDCENRHAEPSEPLTLDELRQMDGKPVYLHMLNTDVKCWAVLMEFSGAGHFVRFNSGHNDLLTRDYGKTWLAYRHRPERRK